MSDEGGPGLLITVLGAGRMGSLLVARWVAAGHEVHVVDPDPRRCAEALDLGAARVASSLAPGEVTGVLATVLPGAAEVAEEMLVRRTVDRLSPGSLWLDLTSGDPATTRTVAAELAARSVGTVAAAMAGGTEAARSGSLELLVGGVEGDVRRVRPLLDALSEHGGAVRTVGRDVGAGQVAKLVANLLWFGQAVAVTEALLLGQAEGVEPVQLVRLLRTGAGGSAFLDRHADLLLAGDDMADFGVDRVVEELDVLERSARAHGLPFDLSQQVVEAYRAALVRFGPVDGELLASRLVEERAGRTLAADPLRPGSPPRPSGQRGQSSRGS